MIAGMGVSLSPGWLVFPCNLCFLLQRGNDGEGFGPSGRIHEAVNIAALM